MEIGSNHRQPVVCSSQGHDRHVIPIFEERVDGAVGYTFPEFRSRFLEICEEHLQSRRAFLFALLLFDVDTPEIAKVLRDPDYWAALDKISGRYLTVFTLLTQQPRSDYRREQRSMVGIDSVPDRGMKLQLILNSYFGLETRVNLPSVLLFQVAEGKVSWYTFVQLRAGTVESSFGEIRDLLRDLADALSKADPGSINVVTSVEAIESRLLKRKAVAFFKTGKKLLEGVKELSDFTGMLG